LQLALFGHRVPTYQTLDDLIVQTDGRIGWTGGTFATLPADAKQSIWQYLAAAAADEPDECFRHLVQLMRAGGADGSQFDMVSAFRQVVTFSQWDEDTLSSDLTMRVLRHYQLMHAAGYRPLGPMVQFYRGLFSSLSLVHQICKGPDPLLLAVEEVWVKVILEPIRNASNPEVFGNTLVRWAVSMMAIPTGLHSFLDSASRAYSSNDGSNRNAKWNSNGGLLSIVLILTAILIVVKSPALTLSPAWSDRMGFAVCALIGGLVLYMAKPT
jgi:hypothetical protein